MKLSGLNIRCFGFVLGHFVYVSLHLFSAGVAVFFAAVASLGV